jgi:hypothetical protein
VNDPTSARNKADSGVIDPAAGSAVDTSAAEIPSLQDELESLDGQSIQRQLATIQRLYRRSLSIVNSSIPSLIHTSAKPLPSTHLLQLFLKSLAGSFLRLFSNSLSGDDNAAGDRKGILYGALDTTAQRILIGLLTSNRVDKGLWRQFHQIFQLARANHSAQSNSDRSDRTFHDVYFGTVLLGCTQPACASTVEVAFLNTYFRRHAGTIEVHYRAPEPITDDFWIAPQSDVPALSCSRKRPPPDTAVLCFSSSGLSRLIRSHLVQLDSGTPPSELQLADYTPPPTGESALRHVAEFLDNPRTRRFPRRRQNYRGEMCFGIEHVFQVRSEPTRRTPSSYWMIINESPDGYAAMHISGKAIPSSAGDIAALRTENSDNWQLCLIRWMHSANPEHHELGLQILATRFIPAKVTATPAPGLSLLQQPALYFPPTPPVHEHEALLLPAEARQSANNALILIIEQGNVSVREIRLGPLEERTPRIDIFRIAPA